MPERPAKIAIIGGDGRRSGVPSYISMLCAALDATHAITVLADVNRGGYDFMAGRPWRHGEIPGLASGLNPFRILGAWRRLRRVLRAGGFDLVWANSSVAVLLARLIHAEQRLRRRPARLMVTYHGIPFGPGRDPRIGAVMRVLETLSLRLAPRHGVVFISEMDRRQIPPARLRRHRVFDIANCSQLGAGARPVLPRPAAGRRIVMTSRVSHQKNLMAAADILAALPDGDELCLVGPDTDSPAFMDAFRARLPAERRAAVRFAGMTGNVAGYLASADLYLMTSRYEGMPIGAIEAFEAGLPIAMPEVGGYAELAAAHPLLARIDVARPAEAVEQIAALLARYRSAPEDWAHRIAEAWRRDFSFEAWQGRVRAAAAEMLAAG